jgi:class 3 adenylate cyclase
MYENLPAIVFFFQSNEGVEYQIAVPDGHLVQTFLASQEFLQHQRIQKEKGIFLIDLVEFSTLSIDDQLNLLVRYQCELNKALSLFKVEHKISIGDGSIIVLATDEIPNLLKCIQAVTRQFDEYNLDFGHGVNPIRFRMGINVGLCYDFRDINGDWNIVGPGVNDTQRVSSFAESYQIIVSREVRNRLAAGTILPPDRVTVQFTDEVERLDKHNKPHWVSELRFVRREV